MTAPTQLRLDLQLVADQVFAGARVLDLGCGSGSLLAHLMERKRCTGQGVEIDPDSVLAAIRRGVPVLDRRIEDGRCVERSLHAGSGVRVIAVDQAGDGIGLRETKARADVLYGVTGLR